MRFSRDLGEQEFFQPIRSLPYTERGEIMTRTNQQRYDESLAYLKTVSMILGNNVDSWISDKAHAGGEISLGGAGYWHSGTDDQHKAVRAYLLCMIAYGRPPYASYQLATTVTLDAARRNLHGKSVQQVREQINCFLPVNGANRAQLAMVARDATALDGVDDPLNKLRTDKTLGNHAPICYHGVKTWLYLAGFVSRRWLIQQGRRLDANTCNQLLGEGTIVTKPNWGTIPEGYFWNIHKQGDVTTCHWGVSLGNDTAVACNNTGGTLINGATFILTFSKGDARSGICKFTDLCKVCDNDPKYRPKGGGMHSSGQNIVVRMIDPEEGVNFY
jgi:hypothetical protein